MFLMFELAESVHFATKLTSGKFSGHVNTTTNLPELARRSKSEYLAG